MFEENYEKLTKSEQNQFQSVVGNLLYHCYIVRRSFDKITKMNKINPNYLFVERHFDLINDYLSFSGIELSKDEENGVIFTLSMDDTNRIRIDGVTTLIIFALRTYYEEKTKDNPTTNDVFMDAVSLKMLLKELSLSTTSRRISALTIQASLRTLATYNVLSLASGSFSEGSYSFYILPTIRYVISNAKLNALYEMINKGSQDDANQEVDDQDGEIN